MDLAELKKPFPTDEIKWRIGQAGKKKNGDVWAKVLAYVDNRCIQDRLDEVCGPANWRNEFQFVTGGVLCGISIRIDAPNGGEGYWLTKWDGADPSDIESFKGALSDSMKRAAVQFGIARELYEMGENWAQIVEQGTKDAKYAHCKIKVQGKDEYVDFYWLPPNLERPTRPVQPKAEPPKNGKKPPATDAPGDEAKYVATMDAIANAEDQYNEGGEVVKTKQQALSRIEMALLDSKKSSVFNVEQKTKLLKLVRQALAADACSRQPEFAK